VVVSLDMGSERSRPTLDVELRAMSDGAHCVCGVDEVGRGALGGPVVAAAVILPVRDDGVADRLSGVRDSKQLTPALRLACARDIEDVALGVGVGQATPSEIDALGVRVATEFAVTRAIAALPLQVDLALVDGYRMPTLRVPQLAIVRGDSSVLSIAAASIVAKVTRDASLLGLGGGGLAYGWHENKGYGSPSHLRALSILGPTTEHRLSWAPIGWVGAGATAQQPELPGMRAIHGDGAEPGLSSGAPAQASGPWEVVSAPLARWRVQEALVPIVSSS
jgi:ribonuclease HII